MAIGLIIMAVAAKAVQTASSVNRIANATTEVIVTARATLDIMDQDLRGAFVDASGDMFQFTGAGAPTAAAPFILWSVPSYAYNPTTSSTSTGAKIAYFLDDDELVRYDVPTDTDLPTDLTAIPAWSPTVASKSLVYDVHSFALQYYDPLWRSDATATGPWRSTWDSTTSGTTQYRRLPTFVRIQLEVIDSAGVRDPDSAGNKGYQPFKLDRVIPVGTQTPTR